MADDIQQKIAEALDAGHPMSAIAEHLANHENPDYQAYGKSWIESRNALSTRKSDFQEKKKSLAGSITPMLDLANENPNATLGLLGGAAALYTGYKVKNALEDRRIRRETHESEMEKNKAYVRQVELQAKNVEGTPQPTTKELAQSVKQAEGVTPQTKPNPLNAYAEQKYGVPLATLEAKVGTTLKSIGDIDLIGNTFAKGGGISVNTQPGAFTQPSAYGTTTPVTTTPISNSPTNQPVDELTAWLKSAPTNQAPVVPKPPQSQFDLNRLGQPFNVTNLGQSQDPLAGRGFQYPVVPTPSAEVGVATGNAGKAIQAIAAKEVDKASGVETTGMKPNYNKTKKNPIGPGAYNWLAGQEGPKAPEVWRNLVGEKNIPYNEFMENVKPLYEGYLGSYGEPDPFKQVAKPGEYRRPSMVPENIRGSSNLKSLAGLAGTAGLLMAAASPESKAAMARASEAIKDIGISPEAILRGKGDELGRMGNAYVTAGNPNYLRELQYQIAIEKDPKRKDILLNEFQKIGGSGAGRGIMPASAYKR